MVFGLGLWVCGENKGRGSSIGTRFGRGVSGGLFGRCGRSYKAGVFGFWCVD